MRKFFLAFLVVALTGVATAADEAIPRPLLTAKAGEWVMLLEVAGENIGQKSKITITEIQGEGDEAVVVMQRERYNLIGELEETDEIEVPLARYVERMDSLADKATVGKETLMVREEEMAVTTLSWGDDESGRQIKLWISDDVPVGGVVKSWSSDPNFPASELIDFGF